MEKKGTLVDIGENKLIQIIDNIIYEKTGKQLISDDAFFFSLKDIVMSNTDRETTLVLNSDMLVSSTDTPFLMESYYIGYKAVIMNVSDLIVKGVKPYGIVISFGLPNSMKVDYFKKLVDGIVDCCVSMNINYIGGDVNESTELIINPTVFGFKDKSKIIYREGAKAGDILVVNGKFGLTGVGFDILLNKKGDIKKYSPYKKSVNSVLKIRKLGNEALILADHNLATSSIDSSDGLAKSLNDLMQSNPKIGFDVVFNEMLIEEEAIRYSNEFDVSIEKLVFDAGEEFIHIFTINPKKYSTAISLIKKHGGNLYVIGKVILTNKIYIVKEEKKYEINCHGFEHFK